MLYVVREKRGQFLLFLVRKTGEQIWIATRDSRQECEDLVKGGSKWSKSLLLY